MQILFVLNQAAHTLTPFSDSPHLDAELLLCHCLHQSREYLFSHSDKDLSESQCKNFETLIERRKKGEPVAYMTGQKYFWDLKLTVTPDVLIPRPETEPLVEWILNNVSSQASIKVADLGTGSGAIALSLAIERPTWKIFATDFCEKAIQVAKENAKKNHISTVVFYQGVWCEALPEKNFDILVSNPPYLAPDDTYLPSLIFEPQKALISANNGLADIKKIIQTALPYLKSQGYLILEHAFNQGPAVQALMQMEKYVNIASYSDLNQHVRFTIGQKT